MWDYILNFQWNGWLGICLYWIPFLICTVGYSVRTWKGYQIDWKNRSSDKYYSPRETVGSVLGRLLTTFIPIANLWATVFDLGPKLLEILFDWFVTTFNQPLVPPYAKK